MHPITVVTLVAIIIAEKCDGLTMREIREKAVKELNELGINMPNVSQLDTMMEKELNNRIKELNNTITNKLIEKDAKLIEKDRQLNNTLDKLSACYDKIGCMKKDHENCQKQCEVYEALLGLRYRIEMLENLLYPKELISINNRSLKWKILLETQPNHAVVQQLRDRISRQQLTIDVFSQTISKLHTEYSNSGIHRVKGKLYNETEMEKIIQVNKGNLDELELAIIAILFKKLELNIGESNKTLDTSFKCIRITRIPTDDGIEEKIRNYFRKKKSILRVTKEKGGIYIVEFENMNEAIAAFLNHEPTIDNKHVYLTLWNNNRGIEFIEEN